MGRWGKDGVGVLALLLLCGSPLEAAPWVQANRWMALGPIHAGECWKEVGNPNPTPGHDLTGEAVSPGDDWGGGDIPFVANASTRWVDLGALGAGGDVIDLLALAGAAGLGNDHVKAAVTVYAENHTASPLPVNVCTASDGSIQVWMNTNLITEVACRGTGAGCDDLAPAVLVPGKNRITLVVWGTAGGWGFRFRLQRPDGAIIDDAADPEVTYSLDPEGYEPDRLIVTRAPSTLCAGTEAVVLLRGNGLGAPGGMVTVTETVRGPVNVDQVSGGGIFTPHVAPVPCHFSPLHPRGVFSDARDIGGPCFAGSTVHDGLAESYQITAGGDDVWSGGDQFHFAYRKLSGDFMVTAHVAAQLFPAGDGNFLPFPQQDPPGRWGKFGLMARQDCTGRSRYTFTQDSSPNSSGSDSIRQAGRPTHGGSDNFEAGHGAGGLTHPAYLRLDRVGNEFISYASNDGLEWVRLHGMDWGPLAPCEVFVGLAVTSHVGCEAIRIVFDQLSITGGNAVCPPPPAGGGEIVWKVSRPEVQAGLSYRLTPSVPGLRLGVAFAGDSGSAVIEGARSMELGILQGGPVGVFARAHDVGGSTGGSTALEGDVYTMVSSGNDIWDGGDQFQFAYSPMAGDFDLVVEVVERIHPRDANGNPVAGAQWGKHGPMARRDCRGDSRYMHLQTNTGGSVIHWPRLANRLLHGFPGTSNDFMLFNYLDDGQLPRHLRLTRLGNVFSGYLSSDGVNWRPVGSDTWHGEAEGSTVLVGFAATSHASAGGNPSTIKFKVRRFSPLEAEAPIHDDGAAPGDEFFSTGFEAGLDDWQAQFRDGGNLGCTDPATPAGFRPAVVDGRLRVTDQAVCDSSTSVFNTILIDGIDSAIHEFEFDVKGSRLPGGPVGEGGTFTVIGGTNLSRVGFRGRALGYEGLYRQIVSDRNIGNNSFSVEFDTGSNSGTDPGQSRRTYHLGINGNYQVYNSALQRSDGLPPLFAPIIDDGAGGLIEDPSFQGMHVKVRYNRGLVQVWAKANPGGAVDMGGPLLAKRVMPISFAAPEGELAAFGFTSATGEATETLEFDNLVYRTKGCDDIPEVAIILVPAGPLPEGSPIILDGSHSHAGPGDTGNLSYSWMVVSGLASIDGPADGPQVKLLPGQAGQVHVRLTVDDGACGNADSAEVTITVDPAPLFLRGDFNCDGCVNLRDAHAMASRLLLDGLPTCCEDAADVNDDGEVEIGDMIALARYAVASAEGSPLPGIPGPGVAACGPDTTSDALTCGASTGCAGAGCDPRAEVAGIPVESVETGDDVVLLGKELYGDNLGLECDGEAYGWEVIAGPAIISNLSGPEVHLRALEAGEDVAVVVRIDERRCRRAGGGAPPAEGGGLSPGCLPYPNGVEVCMSRGRVEVRFSRRSFLHAGRTFLRGNCNGDFAWVEQAGGLVLKPILDVTDAIVILDHLFLQQSPTSPPCPEACNSNGDSQSDVSDAIWLLNFLFLAGPPPPGSFPACDAFPGCPTICP